MMKATGHIEKWGAGILGAVSLVLLVNLVLHFTRLGSGKVLPVIKTSRAASEVAGKRKVSNELSRYDPIINLELLQKLESRPLPELNRNPSEFEAPPAVATPVVEVAAAPAPAPAQLPPPPPPPVTLKPMGYSGQNGGVKEAMVSDDDQVFVVHEGDSVGTRYRVIKITPAAITVEDAKYHQTVDLPVPQ